MSFTTTIDQALAAPLAIAAERPAVGYIGADVPVELILAAGKQPIRLRGSKGLATPRADRFVEASFSLETRRIAEQWLAGELDALEAVVFSRSDDSAQRLYYYICELQRIQACRGPKPLLFDVATLPRATSLAHTIDSTRRLAAELGTVADRLPQAIEQAACRRALLARLQRERLEGRLLGSLAQRIVRALELRWDAALDEAALRWLDTLEATSARRRLVLVGSEPLDEALHVAVEAAGATIVAEINEASDIEATPSASDDPFAKLAAYYSERTRRARDRLRRADALGEHVQTLRADGAILWLLSTDTGIAWAAPRIEQALRTAGCAVLELVPQDAEPRAALLEQVAAFARSLEVQ
jgi:hypothetical protein